jgi:hypothetical protein
MTYLRFTPKEFRAVRLACRAMDLHKPFTGGFKLTLVQALLGSAPELAHRLTRLSRRQLELLYGHLQERRQRPAGHHRPAESEAGDGLTAEEFQAVARACPPFVLQARFLPLFKRFLARHFGRAAPALARKLARLSDRQVERLYGQVTGTGSGRV